MFLLVAARPTALGSVEGKLSAVSETQLAQDLRDVVLRGTLAYIEWVLAALDVVWF